MSFINTGGIPPGSLTEVTTEAKWDLGKVVWSEDGNAYRYVQFADAVAVAVGHVMCYDAAQTNAYVVTNDRSGDEGSELAAGVAIAAVATNTTSPQYGFIQVSGYCATILGNDNDITAGTFISPHASVDGAAETLPTDKGETAFGVCLTNESGTSFDALLKGML